MSSRISNLPRTTQNPHTRVTAGNQAAMKSLQAVMANPTEATVTRQTAVLTKALQGMGVKNTDEVWYLLENMRKTRLGNTQAHGWLNTNIQNMNLLGLSARALPLGNQAAKSGGKGSTGASVENSILNVKNRPAARKPIENAFEDPVIKGSAYQYRKPDSFEQIGMRSQGPQAVRPKTAPKSEVPPALERAITSIGLATKTMPEGTVKSALEAVHSALELAKVAKQNGDPAAYVKAIANLSAKSFELVGSLVKTFGQDPELAAKAAGQLGKIAGVLGKVAGPLGALDNASKVFTGKTLDGAAVDKNARAEAAYDLVGDALPGPVKAGMAISKAELVALYNFIGVPVRDAIEDYGTRNLFNGKTADQMKAAIDALPTDEANANATVKKLLNYFPNTTSGFSQATASDLWRRFMAKEMASDAEPLKAMIYQNPKKPNAVPDLLREVVAERMKHTAQRFVDQAAK